MLKYYITTIRPRQWTKNLVLFVGIIFAHRFMEAEAIVKSVFAFLSFCLVSSSIYLINDIKDIESDKQHPVKKNRPIPSGKISIKSAWIYAIVLAAGALCIAKVGVNSSFFFLTAVYFLVMTLYSFKLKHIVIVDIMIIAGGFVLRAVAGAVAVEVEISSWLLICASGLALFLIIAKRRHEVVLLGDNASGHRKILKEYGDKFLDQMIAIVTALTLISYMLYTVDPVTIEKFHTHELILTAPFVLYGVFRYLYLIYQKNMGGKPEDVLLNDPPLIAAIILWGAAAVLIIY
jgi:4-hydroxybenzoate polyprenyltransferase